MLTTEEFAAWLEAYKAAWQDRDEAAIANIFTEDASYQETPYTPAMKGVEAIRDYWRRVVVEDQSDIRFDYKIWNVSDDVGVAHWRCKFSQKSSFEGVDLDGIFRCVLSAEPGTPKRCAELLEWWHIRKTTLGEI